MDGRPRRVTPSLQRRLSRALALSIAGVALVAGGFSFVAAYDEARELQDDVLRRVAQLVEQVQARAPDAPLDLHVQGDEDDSRVIVQPLDAAPPGAARPDGRKHLPLPPTLRDGLRTVELDGESYRVLVRTTAHGRRFAVAQDSELRQELARYGALRTVLPIVLLVPVLLLIVAQLVRQSFAPIARLAEDVNQRSEHDLRPMPDDGLPAELHPFVLAINRLLARVEAMVRGQQRFVADAAHELRSPLTALSLQAERLAQLELPAPARERLCTLQRGIERGRQLIDQLLALARAQAQAQAQAQPRPESRAGTQTASGAPAAPVVEASVAAAFRRVLEDLLPLAEARGIDIGVIDDAEDEARSGGSDHRGRRPDLRAAIAEGDLYTLLRNLVDNAIRYTPHGGRVDLQAHAAGHAVRVSVRDSGPGIAASQRERVFDPFYRVPGNEEPGSGLGLSIVQAIAARCGARIELAEADRQKRTGLLVTVTLPRAQAADAARPAR